MIKMRQFGIIQLISIVFQTSIVIGNGELGTVNNTNNPGNDFTASARISDNTKGIDSFVPSDTLNNSTQCDENNEDSCDITNFERCSKEGLCKCLRGYLPNREDNKCVAAQFFRGEIPLDKNSIEKYEDKNTLNYEIRQVLFSGFSSQGLTGILDIDVISMSKKDGHVVFEIALNKDTAPRRQQLQTMYNRGLTASAYVDIDGLVKLSGTNLVLGQNVSMSQYLKLLSEFSHCVDPSHNYCDLNARCTHSMRTFTCQCEEGFDDFSPDIFKAPGEKCKVSCKCENNGTCSEGDGVSACVCPEWFIGTNCEINGKELLIICASVLGGLLILICILCCICVCTVKRRSRKSSKASSVGMGSSLDTSVVKLPRVFMDGNRPYDIPMHDKRRWSYVSEPVRYVDDYMMDDYVHAETLPLPRPDGTKRGFYNAYQNNAYISTSRMPQFH